MAVQVSHDPQHLPWECSLGDSSDSTSDSGAYFLLLTTRQSGHQASSSVCLASNFLDWIGHKFHKAGSGQTSPRFPPALFP